MKKRILAVLLSGLMLISATACDNVSENEIDEPAGSVQSTPDEESLSEDTLTDDDIPTQNETVSDVPGVGQLKLFQFCNLTKVSIWWSDEKEEYYLYINEWDAYRPLVGLSSYDIRWNLDNCIIIDNETTTIVLIAQKGIYDEPTILTYRFNRSNELVELHAVPLNIKASWEYDIFFVVMHDANHGYCFLTPSMDGNQDLRMDAIVGWPLFMFETTDGGKSWNQIFTNTFTLHTSDFINIAKFISPNIGIISFRYVNLNNLCERTYLTVDGGLTWEKISQLHYPFDLERTHTWYSEIIDLEQNEDRYYLTVEVYGTLVAVEGSDYSFPSERTAIEFRFESEDLINWSLIET